MDYQIVWSKTALAALRDLVHFIATDAPEAAVIFGEKIIDKVGSLSLFPRLGRMVP